jgi:hypothetical protein
LSDDNNKDLTKEEVQYAVEFARSLWDTQGQFGIFTPDLLNQLLIDLNIHPKTATYDKIVKALDEAKYSAAELQGYSEWMEYNDILYARTLRYYTNMLSFNMIITDNCPKNEKKSKEYKDDYKRVEKFFNSFDYKSEFVKMVIQMMRREIVYTWLRTNTGTINDDIDDVSTSKSPKYTLQVMPQKYCKLTGYSERSIMLYDFDMNWFLRAGVSLEGYDPSFMNKYKEIFGDNGVDKYKPTNQFDKRNGTFAYWVQTSPDDGAWAFKWDDSNFNGVPYLAPLLQNVITDAEIQQLQKNKDIASAYGLLVGELRMMDKNASQQTQNNFSITADVLAQFLKLIQKGMKSTIQVGAMPTENTDFYQFQDYDTKMQSTNLSVNAGLGASASRVIYSTDKMSQAEVEAALTNDYSTMARLYKQFNTFLEFFVNKKTRKYTFFFDLRGTPYSFKREAEQQGLLDMADRGLVLDTSAWAAAYDYDPFEFNRLLAGASGGDFADNLTQLLSIHTANANADSKGKAGRPRKRTGSMKTQSRDYDTSNE